MKTNHSGNSGKIETVKNAIVVARNGRGDVVQATTNTITQTLAATIEDADEAGTSVTGAIANLAGGALRGTVRVGADVGHAVQGIMVGVLRDTKEARDEVAGTIRHTAQVAILYTAVVHGDIEAAAAAASGALKGASEVSSTALKTVRRALTKIARGAKVGPPEPEATRFSSN